MIEATLNAISLLVGVGIGYLSVLIFAESTTGWLTKLIIAGLLAVAAIDAVAAWTAGPYITPMEGDFPWRRTPKSVEGSVGVLVGLLLASARFIIENWRDSEVDA